jgi:putative ABC transport system ATP-binding protein
MACFSDQPPARLCSQKQQTVVIKLTDISKSYEQQGQRVPSLRNVSLEICEGETVSIVGRSGSGKSTLINIMCALAAPTSGQYHFFGEEINLSNTNSLGAVELRQKCGYISQSSDMMNNLSVLENVKLAAECRSQQINDLQAEEWLERVNLPNQAKQKYPVSLSGGERQRANIARALACNPNVLFADEPTGALDITTARGIINLLIRLAKKNKSALIMVTHSAEYAAGCDRQIFLRDGALVDDKKEMSEAAIRQFFEEPERQQF